MKIDQLMQLSWENESVFVKCEISQHLRMISDCFHGLMAAIPVHQDPVPFVAGHLIIAVSQESLFKELPSLGFQYTLLFCQPHLCPGQPIARLCHFEVSLVHCT